MVAKKNSSRSSHPKEFFFVEYIIISSALSEYICQKKMSSLLQIKLQNICSKCQFTSLKFSPIIDPEPQFEKKETFYGSESYEGTTEYDTGNRGLHPLRRSAGFRQDILHYKPHGIPDYQFIHRPVLHRGADIYEQGSSFHDEPAETDDRR